MDWHLTQNEDYLSLMKERINNPEHLIWVDQFINMINEYELNSIKINDIGCNVGHFYKGIKNKSNIDYRGYDTSDTYINIAIQNFGNYFEKMDITKSEPRNCDISIISATLEHIEEYEKAISNIFNTSNNIVVLRTFIGNESLKDYCKKENSIYEYLIRQFIIEDITNIPKKLGWKYKIINDRATNSLEKNITNTIKRTQKIIIFEK